MGVYFTVEATGSCWSRRVRGSCVCLQKENGFGYIVEDGLELGEIGGREIHGEAVGVIQVKSLKGLHYDGSCGSGEESETRDPVTA